MNNSELNLVVQISGKRSGYIERVSLGANGLTVGRAWDNDIIIQDRYVDAAQLQLSLNEQGVVTIEDLASTNGSMVANQRLNAHAQDYHWGDDIRVGDTTIRIFDVASQVEETSLRSSWHSLQKYLESWQALAVVAFIAVLISTLNESAFKLVPLSITEWMVSFVSTAVSLLVWTLVFGSIGKLVQGQSNMRAHLGLVSLAVIAAVLLGLLYTVVAFNLQSPDSAQWLGQAVYGCLFLFLCYALLTFTSLFGSRAKWLTSILLVGGGIAALNSDSFTKEEHQLWSDRSNSEQITLPPTFLLREPVALEDYFNDVDGLFDRVSKQD